MTSAEGRALRLGGAVVVAAVLVLRVIPAAAHMAARERTKLGEERVLLAETEALVRQAPRLNDSVAVLTRRVSELAPSVLRGTSRAEAEGDLASRVTLSAERMGLTLGRVVPIPDSVASAGGMLHRVTVQASLTGDLVEVLRLMDTLASGQPTLTPAGIRVIGREPGAPVSAPEALETELTVTGWYMTTAVAP